jgi:hypothetical protein
MSSKKNRRSQQPRTRRQGPASTAPPGAVPPETTPGPSDRAPVRPVLEAVRFTEEDPAAWAWLNVWPFLDETVGAGSEAEGSEPVAAPPATIDLAPVPDAWNSGADEWPTRPLPLAGLPSWSDEPPSPARPSRRLAASAALLAAGAAAIGALAWLTLGRGSEVQVLPTRSDAHVAPVPLPPGTAFVRSRVLPSGDLQVTHWIHVRHAVASLTLRTPPVLGVARGSVTVSHLVLATDGTPYPVASIDTSHRGSETFRFATATRVYLRYRLSGAVQPAGQDHRALARLTSLEVTTDSTLSRTTQTVVGARVLALACSPPSLAALPEPCGVDSGGSWHVALGRAESHERVMAQLDLS